jgi:hypothetical protein
MRSILISQRIHVAVFDFHRDSAEPSSEAANIGDPDVKLHKRNYAHRTKPLPRLLTFKQYRRLQRKVFAKALGLQQCLRLQSLLPFRFRFRIVVHASLYVNGTARTILVAAIVLGTVEKYDPMYGATKYWTKSIESLLAAMMPIWSIWPIYDVPFGVYAVVQRFSIPLVIQPQCFCVLCGVTWAQWLFHGQD